jgi:hypothetical protein
LRRAELFDARSGFLQRGQSPISISGFEVDCGNGGT